MSHESTTRDLEELTRRAIEACNRRDFDGGMAMYTPNAVWDMTGLGAYAGRDAIPGLFDEWWSSHEDLQQLLEEVRDHGNGATTFAVARQRARLRGSNRVVEARYRALATWVDGLLERVTTYTDIDQARAAAERLAREPG
jgi:ketosteroid isomerase-like protein